MPPLPLSPPQSSVNAETNTPSFAMHMPLEDTLGLNLLAANNHQAEHNNEHFQSWDLLCLNLMSSPGACLLYTSPSPRDATLSRMPSSA